MATITVDEYFKAAFGDAVLNEFGALVRSHCIRIDSPCGIDCKRAIDHAALLIADVQAAFGNDGAASITDASYVVEIQAMAWNICSVLCNGGPLRG